MKHIVENKPVDIIRWKLEKDEASGKMLLTVGGEGRIPHCSCGRNPAAEWESREDSIEEIRIEEGITEIGINAFKGCSRLTKVSLPESLKRIHAYAFRDCTKLVSIESSGKPFRFILEEGEYDADAVVTFGIEAFRNTPWSRDQWGDFYIRDDRLYAVFTDAEELKIPDGVQVLKSSSLNNLKLSSLTLPDTLKRIEDFAFSGSVVKQPMAPPAAETELAEFALADCSVVWLGSPALRSYCSGKPGSLSHRFPSVQKHYSLDAVSRKAYGDFKRLQIADTMPGKAPEGTFASYVLEDSVEVDRSLVRRLKNNSVILCIGWDRERVTEVKSFVWNAYNELFNEYLMYPTMNDDGELLPWRDSFTYQEEADITAAFTDRNGRELKERDVIRCIHPDDHEEWFLSRDRGNFGGPLELKLLDLWLKQHPGIAVDSDEDNMARDKYRWFAEV